MALTEEDLATLGNFIDSRIEKAQASQPAQPDNTVAQTGRPDVDPEAGPLYYVHLSDGQVIKTHDSGATHMEVGGETLDVIGRYQVHENPED